MEEEKPFSRQIGSFCQKKEKMRWLNEDFEIDEKSKKGWRSTESDFVWNFL